MTNTEEAGVRSEVEDRAPLTYHQLFLQAFDQGEPTGPIGARYHLIDGWLLRGEVDTETLHGALDDVVARHEALRTSVVHDENGGYQRIHPPSPAPLEELDLTDTAPDARERRAEELMNEVESREFDVRERPLLHAVLGRFDDQESVLVLMVHHTAIDGWSMRVVIHDIATRYAARRGHDLPMPETNQYRDFAVWQQEQLTDEVLEGPRKYWHETLKGAQVAYLRADHPRSEGLPPGTAVHRFEITPDVITSTVELARTTRSSPFMVALAAFYALHHRVSEETNLTVPTFTPGRGTGEFEKTVGAFFNFLPLRVDLSDATSFQDVLDRTRSTCFGAYSNDIPAMQVFGTTPDLMASAMADDAVPFVFQVFLIPEVMDGERIGDLELTEIRRRLISHSVASDVPGALWTLNISPTGEGIGSVQFNSNLLEEKTVSELVTEYCRLLKELVTTPDAPFATS